MTHSSALDKSLDTQKDLSQQQQDVFWTIVANVQDMLGANASENAQLEAIQRAWSRQHLTLAGSNGVGLIGLMTKEWSKHLGYSIGHLATAAVPFRTSICATVCWLSPFPPPFSVAAAAPRPLVPEQPPKKRKAIVMPPRV